MFPTRSVSGSPPAAMITMIVGTSPSPTIRLLLAALLALAAVACQRADTPDPKTDTAPTVVRAPFDASLSIADNSGAIRFDGIVDGAESKAGIEAALLAAYGRGRAAGTLDVDTAARPPKWLAGLPGFLKLLATVPGANLLIEGDRVVLSGKLDVAQREALRSAAEQAFPGARLQGLFELPEASTPAGERLSPTALAGTLNRMPVAFKPGSGEVADDSLALVAEAADAIRRAPAGTRLLIVGPVTPSQDAGHDVFLSKQRAEALKVQLILNGISPAAIETRGWGQNADGSTDDTATPPSQGAPMRFELVR